MTKFIAVIVFAYMGVQSMRMLIDLFSHDISTGTKYIILFMVAIILTLGCLIVALIFKEKSEK